MPNSVTVKIPRLFADIQSDSVIYIARGECNKRPFHALIMESETKGGIGHAHVYLTRKGELEFTTGEIESIRSKIIKTASQRNSKPSTSCSYAEQKRQLDEKYLGKKILLEIPTGDFGYATKRGISWDSTLNRWFVYENQVPLRAYQRWLSN